MKTPDRSLIQGLREIDGVHIYGPLDVERRTAIVSFNIEGMDCGEVSMRLITNTVS